MSRQNGRAPERIVPDLVTPPRPPAGPEVAGQAALPAITGPLHLMWFDSTRHNLEAAGVEYRKGQVFISDIIDPDLCAVLQIFTPTDPTEAVYWLEGLGALFAQMAGVPLDQRRFW